MNADDLETVLRNGHIINNMAFILVQIIPFALLNGANYLEEEDLLVT